MSYNSEVEEIVSFVRNQRARVKNHRQFRRRLAAFGFAIDQSDDGLVIAKLPRHRVVCALPGDLCT